MQREMQQALTDPWVRGIEAAAALDRLGDGNAAARFYVQCLAFLPQDWVPEACLEGIVGLGPERAERLLSWMLAEAESITEPSAGEGGAGLGLGGIPSLESGQTGKKARKGDPLPGTVQVRNAALAGLGFLIGGGGLEAAPAAAAFQSLLTYSQGKPFEPYYRGAAAGLGRSRDARAVEPLRRLAKWRKDPDTKQTALRALAVGFADEAAKRQLRQELDDSDPEEQLRAAQALYETGDPAAFAWAVDVITQRRSTDTKRQDIRALVVRDLVELGGEAAKAALARALAEGPGNDWLVAWTQVALLELGDLAQLPRVEAALGKEDWTPRSARLPLDLAGDLAVPAGGGRHPADRRPRRDDRRAADQEGGAAGRQLRRRRAQPLSREGRCPRGSDRPIALAGGGGDRGGAARRMRWRCSNGCSPTRRRRCG